MKAGALSVAKDFLIPQKTLDRYVKKAKLPNGEIKLERVGYFNGRKVFSEVQETLLTDYLKQASDIYYGLTPKELKNLHMNMLLLMDFRFRLAGLIIKWQGQIGTLCLLKEIKVWL